MERIKKFIEEFVKAEAKLTTFKNKTDLGPYNAFLPEYHDYFVGMLRGGMGHMEKEEWDEIDLMVMGDIDSAPPRNPRHLFKISQYTHEKYGEVWVAYVSGENPDEKDRDLTDALFVIEEEGKLAVAKIYYYSNIETDRGAYSWEEGVGYEDLTFESLKGPVKIERYQEPGEFLDGLKHYEANM